MKEEQAKAMHDIVEKLRYLASVDPQTRFCRECADIGIALEAIIASPSAGQWIAVTERLPEPDEEVLGYCTFGSIYACFYRHGEWHDGAWSYPKITHWMPLPAPPLSDIKGET